MNLDKILVEKKMSSKDLAQHVGITEQNISLLKTGKVRGIRFATLEKICEILVFQPGDLLAYDATKTSVE